MINGFLFDRPMQAMEKALDGTSQRNTVLSNNISNVDTPGFKRSDVQFEDELKKALDGDGIQGIRTDSRHIPIGRANFDELTPKIQVDDTTSSRIDGNNVDIDSEMAELAKNSLVYETLVQKLNGDFSKLKYVINGR